MTPGDTPYAQQLRAELVRALAEAGDVKSPRVKEALLRVPRHLFVSPRLPLEEAYADRPAGIDRCQTISQPTIVAVMTEALRLRGGERVLEVGTGSGYQSAVLAELAGAVFSIEFFPELASRAAAVLTQLGYANVRVRAGDGALGWPEYAPFDRVIVTAAAPAVLPAWMQQLGDEGVLVAPVDVPGGQELVRYRRRDGRVERDSLGPVWFVPLLSSAEVSEAADPG